MKKVLFCFLVFSAAVHAQHEGFRLGAHGGFPLSDASDFSSFNLGADAGYLFNVTEKLALGASSGYSVFLGKDDFNSYSFIPVAVSGRTGYGDNFFYAADVGYAAALESGTEGGLYYQAKLGWTNGLIDAFAFYKGISADGNSLSSLGAGIAFKL